MTPYEIIISILTFFLVVLALMNAILLALQIGKKR